MQSTRAAARTTAAALAAASVAASLLAVVVVSRRGAWDVPGARDLPVDIVIGTTFPLCGLLVLAAARPVRAVAAVLLGSGAAAAATALATAVAAVARTGAPEVSVAVQLQSFLWVPAFLPLLTVVPLVFPDGQLPSPRWRAVLLAAVAGMVAMALGAALHPEPFVGLATLDKPVTSSTLAPPAFLLGVALLLPATLLALAAMLLRWRRAEGLARRQLSVLVVAVAALALDVAVTSFLPWPASVVAQAVAVGLLPVAIAVSVTRHRLYDLDTALRRAVTSLGLAACVGGLYLTLFALLDALLPWGGGAATVAAAGLTGLALQPLAGPLARAVDRAFYGDRAQPQLLVARLTAQLHEAASPEEVTEAVRTTVSEHLRLGDVAVDLQLGPDPLPALGRGRHGVPLLHRGQPVGRLVVTPRAGEPALDPRDREALEVVAAQAAPALAAVRLSARLQHSRELLVTAREEERRRLRRDLHDGVGAALAGVRLQLESAQDRVEDEVARRMLDAAVAAVTEAVDGVRHVTDDLRPPALDELGLATCLRLLAERMSTPDVAVSAEVAPLPAVGAAVEVAAYRIAAEALTNARRHASATRVGLCVQPDKDAVRIQVEDDGRGLPERVRPGAVGLESMRLRAEEVGGHLGVESTDRGTRVVAVLPVGAS